MSQQKRKTLQVQIAYEPPRHISHNNPIQFQIFRSYALKLLKKKFVGHKTEYGSKVQSALWKLLDHPQVSLPTKSCPHDLRSFHTSRADYNNNPHSRSVTGAVGGGMRAGWVKREPMEIRSPERLRRRNSSWNLAMWTEQGTGVSFRMFQRRLTCLNVG